jgi:transcriptional regulator with XRE-family HTH domain
MPDPPPPFRIALGRLLRTVRVSYGVTQREVSTAMGLRGTSNAQVSDWESGQRGINVESAIHFLVAIGAAAAAQDPPPDPLDDPLEHPNLLSQVRAARGLLGRHRLNAHLGSQGQSDG